MHAIKTLQRNHRAIAWATLLFLAVTTLYLARPMGSDAKSAAELQQDIANKRAKEGTLNGQISRMSTKIRGLRGRINELQSKQNRIEVDLDKKVHRQKTIAGDLDRSRDRLARLRKRLAHSRKLLAARIVTVYKSGEPDILTVVLNSEGFSELVQRATYMRAIADQDREIITTVTHLKGETTKETVRLAKLEKEASQLVATVRSRRNEVAGAKNSLDSRRDELASVVSNRKGKLSKISASRRHDEEDLAAMQRSNSAIQGYLTDGGPQKRGTGQLVQPTNGSFTSPFGPRWGRLHAGIDIAAPIGTPIYAADTGSVRIAGPMGGYGNYTCIQHSSAMSTCYGHQSRIGVSVGQSVKQGQVIGAVGNTGHSTGPHLHFEVRINGNPVDPMGYL